MVQKSDELNEEYITGNIMPYGVPKIIFLDFGGFFYCHGYFRLVFFIPFSHISKYGTLLTSNIHNLALNQAFDIQIFITWL